MRCVVVHSGKRDGYNVVKSFGEDGLLITDFYPTGIFRYIPKVNSRFDASVTASWSIKATLFLVLLRLTKNQRYSVLRDKAVSRYAASIIKVDDFIIVYQGFAISLIHLKYVLFLFHPYFKELRNIYTRYTSETVGFLSELEVQLGGEIEYYTKEILNASSVIVASRFSENSLRIWHGDLNIHQIPYGVKSVGKLKRSHVSREKISVLFWGQYVERKGVQFLKDLNSERFDLNILWRDRFDSVHRVDWAVHYNDLPWGEVENLLSRIDVLLMPSIAEGYGQVALEALSYGIPVIGSYNSVLQELDRGVVAMDPEDVIPFVNNISIEELDILKHEASIYSPLSWACFRKAISDLKNS
jgi:glycosyltransferase involved in cell wall biosynthesis